MEQFSIYEGHMDDLMKKITKIQNKCKKYGCEFHFSEIGEEFREVEDPTTLHPLTGKPVVRTCRFVLVEAEGTAKVNDWLFVASVEHTEKGNIFAKAKKEAQNSNHIGNIGDRIQVSVQSVKCLTSWENTFSYYPTTTYLYKIVDQEGNVFTWKTANFLDEDNIPQMITGTVKEHSEFRGVKQTVLTRCKI